MVYWSTASRAYWPVANVKRYSCDWPPASWPSMVFPTSSCCVAWVSCGRPAWAGDPVAMHPAANSATGSHQRKRHIFWDECLIRPSRCEVQNYRRSRTNREFSIPGLTGQTHELMSLGLTGQTWNWELRIRNFFVTFL